MGWLSWSDWALVGVTLATLVYLYSTWTFNFWKQRGVPFVPPVPFFGNFYASTFQKISMGQEYVELYKHLKAFSYGGVFKFRQPCVLICDPELAKQVVVKDFAHFHDIDIDITIDVDPLFGRNPFALRGERWKAVRSQLTPAFTPGKLKPLFPLISGVCQDLKTYLQKEHPDGLEAKELATKYTTDVTASCIFGLNGNSFTDPEAEFRRMQKEMMPSGIVGILKLTILFMLPAIAKIFKLRFFNDTISNFFRRVTKDVMTYREENHVTRQDFMQLLIQLKARGSVTDEVSGENNEKFTDEDVAAQAMTFFTDGSETSAGALSFALFELAVNPECLEQLRAEVDQAFQKHDDTLSYEMMQDVPYADMVLSETLRKYPIGPVLTRLCTRPYDLPTPDGGTLKMAVGTPIAIPVLGFHTDPVHFPDPDRFDPGRFTEEGKAGRHPYAYMPFGSGPRVCLGFRFAQMQMKAALVTIAHSFDIRACARTRVPVVLDPTVFLLSSLDGLWLQFIPRAHDTRHDTT